MTRKTRAPTAAPTGSRWVYPRLAFDKAALLRLYASIGEPALRYAEGRPLTVVRCRRPITRPDALRSQCAYVRHTPAENAWAPETAARVRIRELKKVGEYLYLRSVSDLHRLLERDVVEWHVWNARVEDVEHPDRLVFDLDPGDDVSWDQIVQCARLIRDQLRLLALESWPKTTGGKGLHVVAPFRAEHDWETVFTVAKAVADSVAASDPARYTILFSKADRRGKVLIDYKRNHRTSIAVAAFSTRANPAGTISVPVSWRELSKIEPDQFTVANIEARVRRADPWAGFWDAKQRLRLP